MLSDDFALALGLARGPSRILLVEDDMASARTISTWLEEAGHAVDHRLGTALVDGALHGVRPDGPLGDFDAAVLDYYFPGGLTGGSLASLIRRRYPGVPIVGVSSVDDANRRIAEAGAGWTCRKSRLTAALRGG